EHLLAAAEPRGEGVARHVLVEKVGIHVSWDDTLAGEFSQASAPDCRPAAHSLPLCKALADSRRSVLLRAPSAARSRCRSSRTFCSPAVCRRRSPAKTKMPADTAPAIPDENPRYRCRLP